jgi:hypothetical protein
LQKRFLKQTNSKKLKISESEDTFMSDLLRIENIRKKNGDVKAFPLASNLKSARHGKGTWGEVVIAVDAESINRMLEDDVVGVLYIIGKDEWQKEANSNK